jgi:hypothetical protein
MVRQLTSKFRFLGCMSRDRMLMVRNRCPMKLEMVSSKRSSMMARSRNSNQQLEMARIPRCMCLLISHTSRGQRLGFRKKRSRRLGLVDSRHMIPLMVHSRCIRHMEMAQQLGSMRQLIRPNSRDQRMGSGSSRSMKLRWVRKQCSFVLARSSSSKRQLG